jgi:hypothetical protein
MAVGNLQEDQKSAMQEYLSYTQQLVSSLGTDILKFWEVHRMWRRAMHAIADRISQLNKSTFPTLFAMAMDYLPIQALSVPCARVFSSSTESDTKYHNCMSPVLMEALQMLKFTFKKECLNFTLAWMIKQKTCTLTAQTVIFLLG